MLHGYRLCAHARIPIAPRSPGCGAGTFSNSAANKESSSIISFSPIRQQDFFISRKQRPSKSIGQGNPLQGNSFASLLLGYGDPGSSSLSVFKSVANKSKETAFYVQDDWKVTPKLTVNLGVAV